VAAVSWGLPNRHLHPNERVISAPEYGHYGVYKTLARSIISKIPCKYSYNPVMPIKLEPENPLKLLINVINYYFIHFTFEF